MSKSIRKARKILSKLIERVLKKPKQPLGDFLLSSPLRNSALEIERDKRRLLRDPDF